MKDKSLRAVNRWMTENGGSMTKEKKLVITQEHVGYGVRFNLRHSNAPYPVVEEKEGVISMVKGSPMILFAVDNQLRIKVVNPTDIIAICDKVVG